MKLGKLIDFLKKEDETREIPIGFTDPHSHRADYSELAFSVKLETTIGSLLRDAEFAVNRDFEGYKGGSYRMTLETECYLTADNSMCGISIDDALLDRLLSHDLQVFTTVGEIDCVCKNCKPCYRENYNEDEEQAGYVLAMRLLQSDLDLDDVEINAIAKFISPRVLRKILKGIKND